MVTAMQTTFPAQEDVDFSLSVLRINGGVVSGPAGSEIIVTSSNGTLDNVRLDVDLRVEGDGELTVLNGLELNRTATLQGTQNRNTRMHFSGTQTLSGTGEVVLTHTGGNHQNSAETALIS